MLRGVVLITAAGLCASSNAAANGRFPRADQLVALRRMPKWTPKARRQQPVGSALSDLLVAAAVRVTSSSSRFASESCRSLAVLGGPVHSEMKNDDHVAGFERIDIWYVRGADHSE
jgi:hypothetical protein